MSNPVFVPALIVGAAVDVSSTTVIIGSMSFAYAEASADFELDDTNRTLNVLSDDLNVQLPTAMAIQGREYVIKNSSAAGCKIHPFGSELIDGTAGSVTINTMESIRLISTGSGWIRI